MPRQFDFISAEDFQRILDQQPYFRCPVCKSALLRNGSGELLCPSCKGNALQSREFGFGLSEEVVKMIASGPEQKNLAGLARVHMHWQMRVRPFFFNGPIGGANPSEIRDILARYVRENVTETTINCCKCDEMIRDSDPDDPLVCPSCGSNEVEARSLILAQIVHMANKNIKLQ